MSLLTTSAMCLTHKSTHSWPGRRRAQVLSSTSRATTVVRVERLRSLQHHSDDLVWEVSVERDGM
jgi:hypothetical protein